MPLFRVLLVASGGRARATIVQQEATLGFSPPSIRPRGGLRFSARTDPHWDDARPLRFSLPPPALRDDERVRQPFYYPGTG
jgi:hypothetical protein